MLKTEAATVWETNLKRDRWSLELEEGEEHSLNVASGGVEDVKGNPADKSKTGGWFAAAIILGVELSERMCIVGISSNLVTYLVGRLHISNADSANIVTNFMGTLYILCLFGGFISDSLLGRYRTIAIFATILALGVSLLAFSTSLPSLQPPPCTGNHRYCIPASGKMLAMLYASLYITAFGVGGVKSNVSGFGSDQFDNEDPKERKKMIYFFNRFYFCISLGSLFAVSVLVYIQDYVGRGWGYGISAGSTVLAVLLFLAGSSKFRYRKPAGSPITRISQVLVAAWRNRKQSLPSDSSLLNQDRYAHPMEPAKRRILHTDQFLQSISTRYVKTEAAIAIGKGIAGGKEHSLNVASGGVEDVKGNPADKSKTGGWFAAAIILQLEHEIHEHRALPHHPFPGLLLEQSITSTPDGSRTKAGSTNSIGFSRF
eukprot:Gb_32317 [translate_table: standard]